MPRVYEEDENEEVGRPEGPRDSQVDPYAWGGADFRAGSSSPRSSRIESSIQDETHEMPEVEVEREPMDEEGELNLPESTRPPEPTPPSSPSSFGRRRARR